MDKEATGTQIQNDPQFTSSCGFTRLPDESLLQIFGYLDVVSKIRLQRVSKKWKNLLEDPSLYKIVEVLTSDDVESPHFNFEYRKIANGLFNYLNERGLSKSVKHFIISGIYNYLEAIPDEPHDGERAHPRPSPWADMFFGKELTIKLGLSSDGQRLVYFLEMWLGLETVTFRNVAINLDLLNKASYPPRTVLEPGPPGFRVRLINVSLLAPAPHSCKFEIPCADVTVDPKEEHVEVTAPISKSIHNRPLLLPRSIQRMMSDQMKPLSDEQVAALKETYSELVKGKPGCMLRYQAHRLLRRYYKVQGTKWHFVSSSLPAQLKYRDFDFESLDPYIQHVFVYFSKPRNSFQPVDDGTEEDVVAKMSIFMKGDSYEEFD